MSPNAFDASHARTDQVSVRKPGRWGAVHATGFLQRGQKSAVEVTLDAAPAQRAQLDLVLLIADAPPHLDYGGPQYDEGIVAALGKGIKIFSVGASCLDKQGEYVQRQMAQYTGGKFVFLTYNQANNPSSGPGHETVHDVQNYGVDTLDRLIVRLVRENLAKLNKS